MENNDQGDAKTLFDLCKRSLTDPSSQTVIEHYYLQQGRVEKQWITYQNLDDSSIKIANVLLEVTGNIKFVIGLLVAPSVELVACILGISRVGYVFAPLEMSHSPELLDKMINSAEMKYVMTKSKDKPKVEEIFDKSGIRTKAVMEFRPCKHIEELTLFEILSRSREGKQDEKCSVCSLCDIAYILHTSGTTGAPKVIAVPHCCIIPNIVHIGKIFNVCRSSKVALMSPPTFDPSIVEMFIALANGTSLIIPSTEIKMDPTVLLEVLFRRAKVTVLQATPALIRRFSITDLRNVIFCKNSSLAVMAFGGEACPSYRAIRQWIHPVALENKTLPNLFYNIYGITEISSWATCYRLPDQSILDISESPVPLGYPLWKTALQVRKEDDNSVLCTIKCILKHELLGNLHSGYEYKLNVTSTGVRTSERLEFSGKLYIGGKERKCYIFGEKEDEFRDSGDLVNAVVDNKTVKLFYLGRSDTMVKRHGQKLYIQSLSEKLSHITDVQASHILPIIKKSGDVEIIAFIARQQEEKTKKKITILTSKQSKMWTFECFKILSEHCTSNLLPDKIFAINILPITLHGKADASLLKSLYRRLKHGNESQISEKGITDVISSFLPKFVTNEGVKSLEHTDCKRISHKTLSQLGGDSLTAVMLINWIDLLLDVSITEKVPDVLDLLFQHSIEDFIRVLTQNFNASYEIKKSSQCSRKRQLHHEPVTLHQSYYHKGGEDTIFAISRGSHYHHTQVSADDEKSKRVPVPSHSKKCFYTMPGLKFSEIWSYNTGKCIDASPLVTFSNNFKDGICFIGSHSHKFCALSLVDGQKIWTVDLPDRIESSACVCKADGKNIICVGCYNGFLYCFVVENGQLWCKFRTGAEVKSSPCWAQGTDFVYVGSHDGYLYALNIKDKKCQWKHYCGGGAVFSSPAVLPASNDDDKPAMVFVGTLGGNLLCLSAKNGEEVWRYNVGKPVFSSPFAGHRGVCIGCVDCFVYFFSLAGQLMWSFRTGQPIFSSPCFSSGADSILVGSHDGHLYNLRITDGCLMWKTRQNDPKSPIYSSPFPVRVGDIAKDRGLVISASTSGTIYVVEESTGEIIVKKQLPGQVFSSPVIIRNEGGTSNELDKISFRIVVGCRDDNIYFFKVTRE